MAEAKSTYVFVEDDHMKVWLYLAPKESGESYTKEEVMALLKEEGVNTGFIEPNIIAMVKKKVYNRRIKVAEAIRPTKGIQGNFEYAYPNENLVKLPKVKEDGSVDYSSMSVITNVKKGEIIARYHPAVQGKEGKDVFGNVIPVEPVRDLSALRGKGVMVSAEDSNVYVATTDGKLEYQDGKINIVSVHTVSGDVDYITGKIEFLGDIHILGNVSAGVVIRAGKTLTIDGTVEGADIYAGGDLVLKRGIQGNGKAQMFVKGDCYAEFLEHAKVKVEGSIRVNSLVNCSVDCGERVILTGKKGSILGGKVHADLGIECKCLGAQSEIKTIVHAGCTEELMNRCKEIPRLRKELRRDLEEILEEYQKLAIIKKKGNRLPQYLENRYNELVRKKDENVQKLEALKEEEASFMTQISRCSDATIKVEGELYRGTLICVNNAKLLVEKSTSFMQYRCISGMIAGNVIVC